MSDETKMAVAITAFACNTLIPEFGPADNVDWSGTRVRLLFITSRFAVDFAILEGGKVAVGLVKLGEISTDDQNRAVTILKEMERVFQ